MIITGTYINSMEDVFRCIESDKTLGLQMSRELCSAITRFCEICGVTRGDVLADPTAIRLLREKASWQLAGLSKESWANMLSRLKRALHQVGVNVDRQRRNSRLSPEWTSLLNALEKANRDHLRRFAGWCSSQGVVPAKVSVETFADFLHFLETQSIQRHLKERWHEARRAWNKAVAVDGSIYPNIPNNTPTTPNSPLWEAYPVSLQQQLSAWRKELANPEREDARRELRPVTIKNYNETLRRYAYHLTKSGIPIEEITSLSALLDVARIKDWLKALRTQSGGELASPLCHAGLHALFSLARFTAVDLQHPDFVSQQPLFKYLKSVSPKVRVDQNDMTPKNKKRLAQFDSPHTARMFRNLPLLIKRRCEAMAVPNLRAAYDMQMAAVLIFLQDAPLRISNTANLDLGRHISHPLGGQAGPWMISIPGKEAKGRKELNNQVSREVSDFIKLYMSKYRPLIFKGPTTAIFVGNKGVAKQPKSLAKQFTDFIRRELGLALSPHEMRHYAGMLWLTYKPGEFLALSKLLGHTNPNVTAKFYAGAEKKTSQNRYFDMLDEMRAEDALSPMSAVPHKRPAARKAFAAGFGKGASL